MTKFKIGDVVRYQQGDYTSAYTGIVGPSRVDPHDDLQFSVTWNFVGGGTYRMDYGPGDTLSNPESLVFDSRPDATTTERNTNMSDVEIVKGLVAGDKVVVIKEWSDGTQTFRDGKVATFHSYSNSRVACPYRVIFDGADDYPILVHSLRRAENGTSFEIGDRVRVVKTYEQGTEDQDGKLGTLVGFNDRESMVPYRVDLDGSYKGWNVFSIEHANDTEADTVTVTVTNELSPLDALRAALAEAEAKHEAFRKQVAELAIETYDDGDGPWSKDGFKTAISDLGLEEFVKKNFEVTVTLTITSEHTRGYSAVELDDEDMVAIINRMSSRELMYAIDEFTTEDQ